MGLSKVTNGENTRLTTVVLVEFTIEMGYNAYICQVVLKVKFSSNH